MTDNTRLWHDSCDFKVDCERIIAIVADKMKTSSAQNQNNHKSLFHKFTTLEKQYGSLSDLIRALRVFRGFERTSPSTVWRWKKEEGNLAKAREAIDLLTEDKRLVRLRLGIPRTLQVLPVLVLVWPETIAGKGAKKDMPFGMLKREGVATETIERSGGVETLKLLSENKVDIAFAAQEVAEDVKKYQGCIDLCQISETHWSGISTHEIDVNRFMAGEINIVAGYNLNTAMGDKLERFKEMFDLKMDLKPIGNEEHFFERLHAEGKEKINAVFGWEPLISQVRRKTERRGGKVYRIPIPEKFLKRFSVKVNLLVRTSVNPRAVRIFLECLHAAANFIMENKRNLDNRVVPEQLSEICLTALEKDWNLDLAMIKETLRTAEYGLGPLNPAATLNLWHEEFKGVKYDMMVT